MFKHSKFPLDVITSRRLSSPKPHVYKFPPLNKGKHKNNGNSETDDALFSLDSSEYQQHLKQGFQDGLDSGFAQGLEEGKKEGYQEGGLLGFEEGMRKGLQEGKQSAHQQFLTASQPFEGMLTEVQHFLGNYEKRRREELLQLVEKVTRQVIRCELALQPAQLLALVEEALASLPHTPEHIRVQLNQEEYRRVSESDPEKAKAWGLCGDVDLPAGECRVITDTTEMDVGCQHRLEQCLTTLKETLLPETDYE